MYCTHTVHNISVLLLLVLVLSVALKVKQPSEPNCLLCLRYRIEICACWFQKKKRFARRQINFWPIFVGCSAHLWYHSKTCCRVCTNFLPEVCTHAVYMFKKEITGTVWPRFDPYTVHTQQKVAELWGDFFVVCYQKFTHTPPTCTHNMCVYSIQSKLVHRQYTACVCVPYTNTGTFIQSYKCCNSTSKTVLPTRHCLLPSILVPTGCVL